MSDSSFSEVIHAPIRLRICGLLRQVDELDFAVLRDTLAVSDATLSKHLKVLQEAGLVVAKKTASSQRQDSRRLTWLRLTPAGRTAFDEHMRSLQRIAAGLDLHP